MSPDLVVIGVDPGPIPGIAVLEYDKANRLLEANALQVSHGLAVAVYTDLIREYTRGDQPTVRVQAERFVVGNRSARSGTAVAGARTRDLLGQLRYVATCHSCWYVERSASEVKPWATDVRLQAAVPAGEDTSAFLVTSGMRHARDAARHALFAAVRDGGVPDPLSKAARP